MPTIAQLINYLTVNGHIGNLNPVTAGDLANHFGISDGGVQVEMRNVIREAISRGELIGSNNRGFYLISNIVELEENLDSLQSRAEGILERRRNTLATWNRLNPDNTSIRTDLHVRP